MAVGLPRDAATWVLFLVGLGCLAFTGWQTYQMHDFLSRAVRTTGHTCDTQPHPCIQFAAADGTPVRFTQNGFVTLPLGAAVPVAYMADDPAGTAQAATFMTTWGEALWMLPAGIGFGILPLFGLRGRWSGSRG